MQEVAQAAGVATGTMYNHFGTREDLVQRLAITVAESLCRVINDSYAHVADAAERVAIGQRRYVWLAAESPAWMLLLIEVLTAAPVVLATLDQYALADLRLGLRQKRFKVSSEAAGMDAISGIRMHAMRRVAMGLAPPQHDVACAALVLRALGVAPEEAAEVARRPLPPLETPPAPEVKAGRGARA